jgi:competence protein ComEC
LAIIIILYSSLTFKIANPYLTVRFLDVGQGDAIQIITPDGYEMLVDGGSNAQVLRSLNEGRSFFDKHIDIVVATHPDTDHIGGLTDVLDRYQVENIVMTMNQSDSPAATAFNLASTDETDDIYYAETVSEIKLGASTTVTFFSPKIDTTNWNRNNSSIVMKISYGEIDFLLTGDVSTEVENYLVNKFRTELASEVLKLGHHGSDTSTSEELLDITQPLYAVVSAGIDNRYGHPSSDVIERVETRNIKTLNTAISGTIEFFTDGNSLWLK